jgi:hypothetical protein
MAILLFLSLVSQLAKNILAIPTFTEISMFRQEIKNEKVL